MTGSRLLSESPPPATVLDAGDPMPLWAQLAAELRRGLSAGEFDDRFPTELELAARFKVSRATVREAIRRLRSEGLLEARRGAGTFVAQRHLDVPILGTAGLAQTIAAAGLAPSSRVLRLESAPAGEVAGAALGIGRHQVVQWVERLRFADAEPFALERSALALSAEQRRAFSAGDLEHGSLYGLLESTCGLRVTGGSERLRAVTCTPSERRALSPGPGEGMLEVERIAHTDLRPVEWRRSLVRGGSYVIAARWGTPPPRGG